MSEPIKLAPYNPSVEMREAMRRIDPALTHEQCRELWASAWSAAPGPTVVPKHQPSPPVPAQAGEVTREQMVAAVRPLCNTDAVAEKLVDVSMDEYRAILALRPQAVPMTDDQAWHSDTLMAANGIAGFKMDALMRIVRAVEAHHGITAKAEGGA